MSESLIREATQRGRQEAERRDLQYKIDDAYHAEVEEVELDRRRKRGREEASVRAKERATLASRNALYAVIQFGWPALCVFFAVNQTWQDIPALDDFLWDREWIAYVGLFFIFIVVRKFVLDMLGFSERR